MFNAYGELNHIVSVQAYADIVSTATNTTHVKVTGHRVMFIASFATITGDSVAVTVEASTAATTTGAEAIPFTYRLGSAAGADTWGAVTTADSTGVDITASDDGKILIIEPILSGLGDDDKYLSVLYSPGASASACGISTICIQDSWYPQLNHISST
jgi:hypothetical protein